MSEAAPTIYYNVDKSNDKYVEYVESTISVLYDKFNKSSICVSDVKDKNTGEVYPVICALVDKGIVPLARLFSPDEIVIDNIEPVIYAE